MLVTGEQHHPHHEQDPADRHPEQPTHEKADPESRQPRHPRSGGGIDTDPGGAVGVHHHRDPSPRGRSPLQRLLPGSARRGHPDVTAAGGRGSIGAVLIAVVDRERVGAEVVDPGVAHRGEVRVHVALRRDADEHGLAAGAFDPQAQRGQVTQVERGVVAGAAEVEGVGGDRVGRGLEPLRRRHVEAVGVALGGVGPGEQAASGGDGQAGQRDQRAQHDEDDPSHHRTVGSAPGAGWRRGRRRRLRHRHGSSWGCDPVHHRGRAARLPGSSDLASALRWSVTPPRGPTRASRTAAGGSARPGCRRGP